MVTSIHAPRASRRQGLRTKSFLFLDLPAGKLTRARFSMCANISIELRNNIYHEIVAGTVGSMRRIVLTTPGLAGETAQAKLFVPAIAHVCKQVRTEMVPLYYHLVHVAIRRADVEIFAHTFCRVLCVGGQVNVPCPRTITILIDNVLGNTQPTPETPKSLDLLPLLALRLRLPVVTVTFEHDVKDAQAFSDSHFNGFMRSEYARLCRLVEDLGVLMACNEPTWQTELRERLRMVLVSPYLSFVDLVYNSKTNHEPGYTAPLKRYYLPEVRLMGLEDVYSSTTFVLRMSQVYEPSTQSETSLTPEVVKPINGVVRTKPWAVKPKSDLWNN